MCALFCSDFVFGLYPPQLIFNITVTIEKVSYSTVKGKTKYEKLDTIVIGPSKRIASSKDLGVRYKTYYHSNNYYYLPYKDQSGIYC